MGAALEKRLRWLDPEEVRLSVWDGKNSGPEVRHLFQAEPSSGARPAKGAKRLFDRHLSASAG